MLPPLGLLRARDLACAEVVDVRAVLQRDVGIGDDVEVPDRVLRRAAERRDDGVGAVVLDAHQRRLAELPAVATLGPQDDDGHAR